jgi:hypothetical protein
MVKKNIHFYFHLCYNLFTLFTYEKAEVLQMRKALMLALGFLVVFSIVLFSGVLPSSKAIAAGNSDGSGNWAKIHKPPAGPLSGAKSSLYYDDPIETTVKWNTAHTYNANETIGTGGTLLIESGGNVTINGDLWVYGNVEILGSGKLTVNGDILNGGDFYIHGSAMVTVNKAKKVVYDGDGNPYYGRRHLRRHVSGISGRIRQLHRDRKPDGFRQREHYGQLCQVRWLWGG